MFVPFLLRNILKLKIALTNFNQTFLIFALNEREACVILELKFNLKIALYWNLN